jgi:hypothetical protein
MANAILSIICAVSVKFIIFIVGFGRAKSNTRLD